jgi:hypothetical protein
MRVEPHVVRIGLDGVQRRQVGQVTVAVTQPEAFGLENRRHRSTVAGAGRGANRSFRRDSRSTDAGSGRGRGVAPAPGRPAFRDRRLPRTRALGILDGERERDRSELRRIEDEAIREAVRRQRDVELDVVSDGEFRRWMCMNSYYDAVSGVRTGKSSSPVAASRTLTALGK